ncbi:FHA domain-containing protein [Paucimonas lemoignei]|uniref:FHA domain-containing protein n=1 Tax=Paucimonas lemoignei TaxID=29443 RepID=A0A4R3HUS8_PAULE|nr:FHA domain-containing protein [Paucimonas lemoignei]TCS35941.1 FHA domain-containing protein [Paucimonas lemoignei]
MAQPTIALNNAARADLPHRQTSAIVLLPISHPDLGEIRIDDNLFAIGRTEAPFDSYPPQAVSDLSRRHARIFIESGAVYIADLDSKNGTTVNGVSINQKITRLHEGDEICFAGRLSYRVKLQQAEGSAVRSARILSLTLSPERGDLGLQPIVISRFPFLISKTDDVFSRYKLDHPEQVNYLSRRHAHIFIKGGQPYIEDLGSTNGTFVNGKRLDEHAVPLQDDDVLAIGGHHFVYKLSVQKDAATLEPTVTRLDAALRSAAVTGLVASAAAKAPIQVKSGTKETGATAGTSDTSPPMAANPGAPTAAAAAGDTDKTTFVAAAGSFLDIFCVDHVQRRDDDINRDAQQAGNGDAANGPAPALPEKQGRRGKLAIFAGELADAFSGGERHLGMGKKWWRMPALAAILLLIAVGAYLSNDPEREVRSMLADGHYAQAADAAARYLARKPEQAKLKALGTEALLKARVPQWQAQLHAHQFQGADALLAQMKQQARHNADVQPLLDELQWVGQLEQFVVARGGADQPVRDQVDDERIRRLLKQWDDDTLGHQQAFNTISSYVPEFRDQYAQSLSHVRKLALVSGQKAKGESANGEQQQQPSEAAH